MKLLLKQYLSSLNERDELDVVLPDVLSEIGFNVISRPKRGTTQYGVDVVAIGPHPTTGQKSLFLLSIKSGDLTRDEWATGKQALRPSLEEILEVYIPKHRHARHKDLPIIIALCFGGDIQEDVRLRVQGFTEKNTIAGQVEFEEWNGDRIAEMMVSGLLRENIFPKDMQNSLRKAVAFVDEPAICVTHFTELLRQIFATPPKNHAVRVRLARQIYLATWTIFVWCRDAGNLESAYKVSALSVLWTWDLCHDHIGPGAKGKELAEVVDKTIGLSRGIAALFIQTHVEPYSQAIDGLGMSVPSSASIDINLKLFEVLGRVSIHGLWLLWMRGVVKDADGAMQLEQEIEKLLALIASIIDKNKTFEAPVRDDHAIEIALASLFLLRCGTADYLAAWLRNVMRLSIFSYRTHGAYPCILREYGELAVHPRQSDGYREEVTAGSILYPTLALLMSIFDDADGFRELEEFRSKSMNHSTWQFWIPDDTTEQHLYRNTAIHGSAITQLNTAAGPEKFIEQVNNEITAAVDFGSLSAITRGAWPLVLIACHTHRLPVPIHFWAAGPESNQETLAPSEISLTEDTG
ncbi:hypothetical protein CO665_27430 [Rhizobium anhuiense]|nr:hypothetical protein CO665_27430 [Rhizobium anhuiense]